MTLAVEDRGGSVRFRIKVQARARREEVAGVRGDVLRLRVTAPPVEGRANRAVVKLLADCLHLSPGSIKIAAGERCAVKLIEVAGLDPATLHARLGLRPSSVRGRRSGVIPEAV